MTVSRRNRTRQADAFLTALVIFIAPILALEDYLGKYRLHTTNLFQAAGSKPLLPQIEHRMAMRATLLAEIQKWLRSSGHDPRSADLRAYLEQWKKAQAQDEFTLQAPGRWKYFRHLLGYPSTYAEIMAPRHRIYSYMRACSALVLGYHHLRLFDDARKKRKEWTASSSEKTPGGVAFKSQSCGCHQKLSR